MKKAFLLLIAVMTLAGTVWFSVGALGNGSVTAQVYSAYFTDVEAGQHVPAQFLPSQGDLQELPCAGTEQPGFIACQFPEEYSGQQLPIQFTKNGVMYVTVFDVPVK